MPKRSLIQTTDPAWLAMCLVHWFLHSRASGAAIIAVPDERRRVEMLATLRDDFHSPWFTGSRHGLRNAETDQWAAYVLIADESKPEVFVGFVGRPMIFVSIGPVPSAIETVMENTDLVEWVQVDAR